MDELRTDKRVQPPMLANQQLVAAMAHPTRAHAVTVLNERVVCAAEIGREIEKPARHVSYHLKQLERLGVIELVKVEKTAGGRTIGRYYRALERSWYDPDSWRQVEGEHQSEITAGILASCNADMTAAVRGGTIHLPDNHLSRTPLTVDPIGYRELVDRLDQLLPEVIEAQQRSAAQMARGDEALLAKVHIIQFPSPEPERRRLPIAVAPAGPEPPEPSEGDLLSALEHPTRVHALMVLNERTSSAAEIGRELGQTSDHVSYHLKRLRELGLIEPVQVLGGPGPRAAGRYYRALIRPWFDLESRRAVHPARRSAITSTLLALCNADIAEAVRAGTVNEPDSHISRTPIVVDPAAYAALVDLLDSLVPELLSIQERAAERIEQGAERISTKVHLFQFESPDPALTRAKGGGTRC